MSHSTEPSAALLRVAEACEDVAEDLAFFARHAIATKAQVREYTERGQLFAAHARAIREGRVQEVGT